LSTSAGADGPSSPGSTIPALPIVQRLGFGVQGLEFWVWGLGFGLRWPTDRVPTRSHHPSNRVLGSGFEVGGSGLVVLELGCGFGAWGFQAWGLGFSFQGLGCMV